MVGVAHEITCSDMPYYHVGLDPSVPDKPWTETRAQTRRGDLVRPPKQGAKPRIGEAIQKQLIQQQPCQALHRITPVARYLSPPPCSPSLVSLSLSTSGLLPQRCTLPLSSGSLRVGAVSPSITLRAQSDQAVSVLPSKWLHSATDTPCPCPSFGCWPTP